MKAEFKRDLKNNYLVIEGQEEAVGNDYCIPMVEQNRIPGLLPFHRLPPSLLRMIPLFFRIQSDGFSVWTCQLFEIFS